MLEYVELNPKPVTRNKMRVVKKLRVEVDMSWSKVNARHARPRASSNPTKSTHQTLNDKLQRHVRLMRGEFVEQCVQEVGACGWEAG